MDDFGRPLNLPPSYSSLEEDDGAPATTPAVKAAVVDAVVSDVRSEHGIDLVAGEETLLLPAKQNGSAQSM